MYTATQKAKVTIVPMSMNEAAAPECKILGWKRKNIAHVSQMIVAP